MPRDLVLANGSLLVNFDRAYNLRDVYYPSVGQENHTEGGPCRFGVWVEGQFAWVSDASWRRELRYEAATLVSDVTCVNDALGLELRCSDVVDVGRNIYVKRVLVRNNRDRTREVRLFHHFDPHLWGNSVGDTAYFDPRNKALVHYKGPRYFWLSGSTDGRTGLHAFATGKKETEREQGTWRDAEDGVLGRNPVAQGSVDSVGMLGVTAPAKGEAVAYFWLIAGLSYFEVQAQDQVVRERGPESFIARTRSYWRLWASKADEDFADLSEEQVRLYKQSLVIIRTQIDNGGAIVSGTDSDILQFGRDTYSYVWPRDGALVCLALTRAGYGELTRRFFEFCAKATLKEGYLLHKYNPDGSPGSTWHPWSDDHEQLQLPIQEDSTALVLHALWVDFQRHRDPELVRPLYGILVKAAAEFLVRYREPRTGLPASSYDLWEERHGIMCFTTAAVWAGLQAAANLTEVFGDTVTASRYRREADAIKQAALKYLVDRARGRFLRRIVVKADGSIEPDTTLDASLFGAFAFGMFEPDDPLVIGSMEAVEERLWCKTSVGGMARYEDDYYYQVSKDISTVPGNPWIICTLWLAQWRIAKAKTPAELGRARELLRWAADHAAPSLALPEQVHPYTHEPISVSPLTWSHATYVLTVQEYLQRWKALHGSA